MRQLLLGITLGIKWNTQTVSTYPLKYVFIVKQYLFLETEVNLIITIRILVFIILKQLKHIGIDYLLYNPAF